jgi:hypothetical protein
MAWCLVKHRDFTLLHYYYYYYNISVKQSRSATYRIPRLCGSRRIMILFMTACRCTLFWGECDYYNSVWESKRNGVISKHHQRQGRNIFTGCVLSIPVLSNTRYRVQCLSAHVSAYNSEWLLRLRPNFHSSINPDITKLPTTQIPKIF